MLRFVINDWCAAVWYVSPKPFKGNSLLPPGAFSSPIGLGFKEAGGLRLREPRLVVTAEGIEEQLLASRAIRLVIAVHPSPPLGLAERDPFAGLVAGPGEAHGRPPGSLDGEEIAALGTEEGGDCQGLE